MVSVHSEVSLDDVDFATPMSPPPRHLEYPRAPSGYGFSGTAQDGNDESDDNLDDIEQSTGNYSPPAWRRLQNGDRWYGTWRGGNDIMPRRAFENARRLTPHCDTDVFEEARRTRLPTGSISPEKGRSPEPEVPDEDDTMVNMKSETPPAKEMGSGNAVVNDTKQRGTTPTEGRENYIRFAMRADIQHRTEPIDAAVRFFRRITKSWTSIIFTIMAAMLSMSASRLLFQPVSMSPVPDLVKVAGLARSFEPLIYYSENGISQVGDLQATGVAVWDLGESVRSSNMTSAPLIVKSLDELSDNLKTLAVELTKFFANVDGDIDSILIVMDWARRELSQLQATPSPPLSTAFSNIHNLLCAAGVLEDRTTGEPTKLGTMATAVFGMTQPQHTRHTLERTFTETLSVLEEAIENELQHSLRLFALFEVIDKQFLNLARIVIRESYLQEEQQTHLLSSMWTRILGAKASEVKKFQRNHELLLNVREKTFQNKGVLMEHNSKLLSLKSSLEKLRQKLVSPLVRSVNSSTLTLDDQIKGLEDVGIFLEGVRAKQKGKLMAMLYGSPSGGGYAGYVGSASARLVDREPHH